MLCDRGCVDGVSRSLERREGGGWDGNCISSSSENGRIRSEELQPRPLFLKEARSREICEFY